MATRQAGTALVAATYSVAHYVVVAGDVVKKLGLGSPPYPVEVFEQACFCCSVFFLVGYILPKLLALNISASLALLGLLKWMGEVANLGIDQCRQIAIFAVESLAIWLRSSG